MTLGITVAAEVLGKTVLGQGLSSQIRPKKYFTVSKATLDNLTGDIHELINFFVIESQRIVFAENVFASLAVSSKLWTSEHALTNLRLFSVPSSPTT
jgi:hypothetical protein